jgi:hypothetical protein
MPSGVCRHYPTSLVHKCRVTSDIKQTAAAFRTITVPKQEFCGSLFFSAARADGWPRRPCLPNSASRGRIF